MDPWIPQDNLLNFQFTNFEYRNKRTFVDVIEIVTLMKNLYGPVLENPV